MSMTLGVAVVICRDGRYLMIRRAAQVVAPGMWCFVGGAVRPGESEPDAVVREFREEVGAVVRPLRRVWEYARADGTLRLGWWEAELLDERLRPNLAEVAEVRWLTAVEIRGLPNVLESNLEFLEATGR